MIAHGLTALRLLLAPPVALGFAFPGWLAPAWLLALLALAIATDMADGWVARRWGTASARGQVFDHATDCLFVTAALAGAAHAGLLTPWLPLFILLAFLQYSVDSFVLHRQRALRMSFLGRWNGIGYFLPLIILALAQLLPSWQPTLAALLEDAAAGLAWLLLASTVVSMVDRVLALRRA